MEILRIFEGGWKWYVRRIVNELDGNWARNLGAEVYIRTKRSKPMTLDCNEKSPTTKAAHPCTFTRLRYSQIVYQTRSKTRYTKNSYFKNKSNDIKSLRTKNSWHDDTKHDWILRPQKPLSPAANMVIASLIHIIRMVSRRRLKHK